MIKALLILAYLACDFGAFTERVSSLGLSPGLAVFLALYLLVAAALFLVAWIRSGTLRMLLALVFAAGSILQQSFERTTNDALTYEAFVNLLNATGQTGEALAQHGQVLLTAVPIALLLFFGIVLPPRHERISRKLALLGPLAISLGLSSLLYARGGEGSRALPAAVPPVSLATIRLAQDLLAEGGPRRVPAPPGHAPHP